MIKFVKKRDGRIIPFNEDRITRAIFLAAEKVAIVPGLAFGIDDYVHLICM